MALDKQRILNELGSVVNQLQSADCGCMGKLFSNPSHGSAMGSSCSGCHRGCCQRYNHNYTDQIAGDRHSAPVSRNVNSMCMGNCNPPKLYADTYNYLSKNLMKPVVEEVYHDLKTINPTNTVMNHPMAGQMGLSPNNSDPQGNMGGINASNVQGSPTMTNMPQNNVNISSQLMAHNPAGPAGQQITDTNNRRYGQHSLGISTFNEMFPGVMQGGDLGFDPMSIALQMNPANHQKAAMDTMHRIMNGNTGSINEGHDVKRNSGFMQSPNIVNAVEAGPQYTIPANETTNQQITAQQAALSDQVSNKQQPAQQISNSKDVTPPSNMAQQQVYTAVTAAPMNQQIQQYQQQQQYQQLQHQEQQQIFDPNTGAMITSPNLSSNQHEQINSDAQLLQQTPSQSQNVAPIEVLPPQPLIKEPIFPVDTLKNRIPLNLKPHNYHYNTLGQPIELTPAQIYHSPEPQLPQTLSPQPLPTRLRHDPMKYSNVKNTVSKTSIIGHNSVGKAPSRNQMQNIYNQYKGSQSFTQQNVKGPHGTTYSDGKLNVTHGYGNTPQTRLHQVPVEKVGGDTIVNNNAANNQIPNKMDQVMGQTVEVPTPNIPSGDAAFKTEPSTKLSKCRNGLQDMTYTSYPISTAWSFHGDY